MRPSKTLLAALLVLVAALPVCAKKEKKAAPEATTAAGDPTASEIVAYVGDQPITKAELDKQAAQRLAQIRQQEYEVRKQTLDTMLDSQLAANEAKARGMSVEELLKQEVDQKVAPTTDEEVAKFYEENKARMGGRTLDQIKNDIKNYLQQQKSGARRQEFFSELRKKSDVTILLEPPRVQVAVSDTDPSRGPKDAPVLFVEFSDFQCPYCKRAHSMVEEVMKAYPDKVRLVYKDFPLAFHAQAAPAAEAAHCAGDQGKYWEYNSNLMSVEGSLLEDDLKKRAETVGLDAAAFATCIQGNKYDALIKASTDQGSSLGVTGTPTFFINGRMMVGARSFEDLKAMIDEEIARGARKAGKAS